MWDFGPGNIPGSVLSRESHVIPKVWPGIQMKHAKVSGKETFRTKRTSKMTPNFH